MAAKLSATLILAGASRSQAAYYDYKILFLQRSAKTSTFASVHVFPGGVVDSEDGADSWRDVLRIPAVTSDIMLRIVGAYCAILYADRAARVL